MAFRQPLVWGPTDGRGRSPWIWGPWIDTLWIAGGASYFLAIFGVPATLLWAGVGPAIIATLLHLGTLVNYPHYAATYALAVRERAAHTRNFHWLVFSSPVTLAVGAAAVHWPETLVLPLVRVYLTWSAYHYSAQHFGIASMYAAKNGQALEPTEKRLLRWSFNCVAGYMMVSFNMMNGATIANAPGAYRMVEAVLPRSIYPLAVALLIIAVGTFIAANNRLRARTGRPFTRAVWLLALTNALWFVVPNVWLPGAREPWLGEALAIWVPIAIPFFHCAQYLMVVAARARSYAPIRPILWMSVLIGLGLLLFEASIWGLPHISAIGSIESTLIVTSVVNIHHFVLDGIVWKRPQAASAA